MPLDSARIEEIANAEYQTMGASQLAAQPPTLPDGPKKITEDWLSVYAHLESRFSALRSWRWSYWCHWSLLAEMFSPRRWLWLVVANRQWRGRPINDQIVNSEPLQAVRVCASGLWTGLTNPARPWFKLGTGIEEIKLDSDAINWLSNSERVVYDIFSQSNFYTTMAQAFHDVSVFGTAPVTIYEDKEDVIRLYLWTAGEYYLGSSARLAIDTQYTECTRTVSQIVEMFTLESCPVAVQKLWQTGGGSLETEFVVCCGTEPNFDIDRRGKDGGKVKVVPSAFTFREVQWLKGQRTARPLSKRGFYSKPFFVMRWYTTSNDPYGRSPCMDALGDSRQIQQEDRRKAEFIEKGVRPPMGADPELKNEPSSILPGMITYMTSNGQKKGFWPLFEVQAQWLQHLVADIDKVVARIKSCLFVDVFMAITQMQGVQPRNELELTKRDLERLQVLGPFITQFETECADAAIGRTLEIAERRGLLPPRPPSLVNMPLKASYQSILRLAQKAAAAVSKKDFAAVAGSTSAAAKAAGIPDPARTVKWDDFLKDYGNDVNVGEKYFFTEDEVKQHDQIRQEELEKAKQPTAPAATMAGVAAAKSLSETKLTDGTALHALLGGAGGGGLPH